MVISSTSQSGEGGSSPTTLPNVRASLRLSMSRQSLSGALGGGFSQKRLAAGGGGGGGGSNGITATANNPRISSPGMIGSSSSINGGGGSGGSGGTVFSTTAAAVAATKSSDSGGGGGPSSSLQSTYGEIPRLPMVSESGDKPRPSPTLMLRRASTVASMNVGQQLPPPVDTSPKDRDGDRDRDTDSPIGGDNVYTLKKERNALRIDKNVLLLNKRRLEALLTKLLEQPLPGEETGLGLDYHYNNNHTSTSDSPQQQRQQSAAAGGSSSSRADSPVVVLRASSTRAQLLKALDESIGLDMKLLAGPGAVAAAFEAEMTRSLDLSAKMAEMQAEHEIAMARLEGELSYRRTQAAASTAVFQKQLNESQEELRKVKQELAGAEAQIGELTRQGTVLREQLCNLNNTLADKSKVLAETRDMLGMEKSTLATIIDMLKEQLREASADRAVKNRLITELEYAIVQRDALLAEAHERMNQAAAQAAAAAEAGVSSSAAVARVAASMQGPLDSKGAWGLKTSRGGHVHGQPQQPLPTHQPPSSRRVSGPGDSTIHGCIPGNGVSADANATCGGKTSHRGAAHTGPIKVRCAPATSLSDEETCSGDFETAEVTDQEMSLRQ